MTQFAAMCQLLNSSGAGCADPRRKSCTGIQERTTRIHSPRSLSRICRTSPPVTPGRMCRPVGWLDSHRPYGRKEVRKDGKTVRNQTYQPQARGLSYANWRVKPRSVCGFIALAGCCAQRLDMLVSTTACLVGSITSCCCVVGRSAFVCGSARGVLLRKPISRASHRPDGRNQSHGGGPISYPSPRSTNTGLTDFASEPHEPHRPV